MSVSGYEKNKTETIAEEENLKSLKNENAENSKLRNFKSLTIRKCAQKAKLRKN